MKKTYSVDVQDGELVSIKIDEAVYRSVDEIPEADDCARVESLIEDARDMEFDIEREKFLADTKPSKMPLVMFLLFLSIAILMLVISALTAVSAVRSIGEEQSLPGRVVAMIERRSGSGSMFATRTSDPNLRSSGGDIYYYPEVEISFPDETTKRLQLAEGSWPPAFEVGEQVTVLYNTTHPRNSSIQTSSSALMRFFPAMITGFLGLCFLVTALLVRRFSKPGPKEGQKSSE